MPPTLLQFVWRVSGWHQLALVLLSAGVLAVEIAPLEIQRRVVNEAFKGGEWRPILVLVGLYLGVTAAEGLLKLALNLYRNLIGERAVLWLRQAVFVSPGAASAVPLDPATEGVQISIVLDEADPVGGFVGVSLSEPVLQAGVLLGVAGYLLYLQPLMGLIIAAVFVPQILFVPPMQAAINRRIAHRVQLYRGMSGGIVDAHGAHDADGAQAARISGIFATNMSIYRWKFTMNLMMNLVTHSGVAGILALGGWFVVSGQTEIGTVVAFLAGLSKINDPWGELVNWYRDMKAAQVKYTLIRDAAQLGAIDGDHLASQRG